MEWSLVAFVVIRCATRSLLYHSLSLVVIRCHSLYHSLSLVVTRCTTRLSFYKRSYFHSVITLTTLKYFIIATFIVNFEQSLMTFE